MSATIAVADDLLRSFFERWQRLEAAKKEIADDLKELFAEAKWQGFQPKAMRVVFTALNRDNSEAAKVEEFDAICDLYRESLTRGTRAYTREGNEYAAAKGAATDEPTTATDVVGNYLREPAAVVSGQIIREGDAPRETNRTSGDASRPDTEFPLPASSSQQARAEADTLLPSASATLSPAARFPTGAGGHLSEPSPDAGAGQQAADADHSNAKSGQAANSISDEDVPAFLKPARKTPADYRPHCKKPDACAASGLQHCYSCTKAMAEHEAA